VSHRTDRQARLALPIARKNQRDILLKKSDLDQLCHKNRPAGLTTDRLDGMDPPLSMDKPTSDPRNALLDAAEMVVVRRGIANLTLEAVASEAGMSKGGLLHYFPNKDRLIEALVVRHAQCWRECYMQGYNDVPPGPGRMTRGLVTRCLAEVDCWTDQLRRSTSAVFAALAQNPSLIEPMREAYAELHQRLSEDGLPPGISEAVVSAIDGLWLYWVLGLVPVDQARMDRLRAGLITLLAQALPPEFLPPVVHPKEHPSS